MQSVNAILGSGRIAPQNGYADIEYISSGDGLIVRIQTDIDLSGITSGTSVKYKITTHNQSSGSKVTRVHATSLGWR